MAAWTLLLGIIFIVEVWRSLSMPEFSDTLLTLMGISSGTYLGFMMTEPHSSQMATPDPAQSTASATATKGTPTTT